jgi:hypothetical protein
MNHCFHDLRTSQTNRAALEVRNMIPSFYGCKISNLMKTNAIEGPKC